MFKTITLIVALFYTSAAFGDCVQPVKALNEGDAAPCTGFLFSPAQELKVRTENEEYKNLQEQQKIYIQEKALYEQELTDDKTIIDKQDAKILLWRQTAEDVTTKYMKAEENRGLRDWLFLVAGVALTVGAGYAVGQAHK